MNPGEPLNQWFIKNVQLCIVFIIYPKKRKHLFHRKFNVETITLVLTLKVITWCWNCSSIKSEAHWSYSSEPVQCLLLFLSCCASEPNEPALLSLSFFCLVQISTPIHFTGTKRNNQKLWLYSCLCTDEVHMVFTLECFIFARASGSCEPAHRCSVYCKKHNKRYLRNKV